MADVIGPTAYGPGSTRTLPDGQMCDDHPDRPAVKRVQGETDSFGAELIDWCQECVDQYEAWKKEDQAKDKYCEWCKQVKPHVRPYRDIDEGSCGPLYDVCSDCRDKDHQAQLEELDRMRASDRYYDDWDEDPIEF